MTGGRIALIVAGSLLALIGLAVAIAGCAVLWANSQRDEDGFWTTGPHRLESGTAAIVSEPLDVEEVDIPFAGGVEDWVTIRLQGALEDPEEAVFIGIGRTEDVDRYLAGVAHDVVDDFDVDPFEVTYEGRPGEPRAPPPGGLDIWEVSAAGPGERLLEWDLRAGDWTAVVMRADGGPGVAVDASFGARIENVVAVGVGLLVGGLLVLGGGATMIAFGARRRREGEAEGAMLPVAAAPGVHPVRLEVRVDPGLSRALWLVKWLLAIPHLLVLIGLWVAFAVVTAIAFFAILFTGRYPRGLFDFNVGVLRWWWRVSAYAWSPLSTDRYPPFSLSHRDDHATLDVEYPERLSRGLVLVKWWLLAIPHYAVVSILSGGGLWGFGVWDDSDGWRWAGGVGLISLLTVIGAVFLIVRRHLHADLLDLIVGLHRWTFRVIAYAALMTDRYPPFRLDQGTREPAAPPAREAEPAPPAPPAPPA